MKAPHERKNKWFRIIADYWDHEKIVGRIFYCPGCKYRHYFDEGWSLKYKDGKPTVSPSIFVKGKSLCHLFIIGGRIQYLSDCTHELADKTVNMVME